MSNARTSVVLIAALFFACGGTSSDTTQKTSHALSVVISGNGSVSSNPAGIDCGSTCSASFDAGTAVTLTASAKTGSDFTGWSGACSGTGACTVTMSDAESVTATFAVQRVQLSLGSTDDGSGRSSLSVSPQGTSCGNQCFTYDYGTQVTVTANPAAGFLVTMSGGGCSGAGPCTLTLTANAAVTAVFTLSKVQLFISTTGTGAGTVVVTPAGTDCGAGCHELAYGTSVTIDGQPAVSSSFTSFAGAGCGNATPCQAVLTDPATTVTASFTLKRVTFILDVVAGTVALDPPGTQTCDTCRVFDYGTQVTITAAPLPDTELLQFALCGNALSCTVTATVNDTMVRVFFQLRPFPIHVDLKGRGAGTVSGTGDGSSGLTCTSTACDGTVIARSSITLVASTLTGFAGWTGGGCSGVGPCTLDFVEHDVSIGATFSNRGTYLEADEVTGSLWRLDPHGALTQLGGSLRGLSGDLAWDPVQGVLYFTSGLAGSDATLLTLDPLTGKQSSLVKTGVDNLDALAFRPVDQTLYAVGGSILYKLIVAGQTVVAAPVGATGVAGLDAMAWDYTRGRLVAARGSDGAVFTVDASTGAATLLFAPGLDTPVKTALLYDGFDDTYWTFGQDGFIREFTATGTTGNGVTQATGMFAGTYVPPRGGYYAVDEGGGVKRIDPGSFASTSVGSLGVSYSQGDCAFDNASKTLFLVDGSAKATSTLYGVELDTGTAIKVGDTGVANLTGLAAVNGTLFATSSDGKFYTLSRANGIATPGLRTAASIGGLAWDTARQRLVGLNSTPPNMTFVSVNTVTGAATTLTATGTLGNLGLTYDWFLDRFVAAGAGGSLVLYDPVSLAGTVVANGLGANSCLAFVPYE